MYVVWYVNVGRVFLCIWLYLCILFLCPWHFRSRNMSYIVKFAQKLVVIWVAILGPGIFGKHHAIRLLKFSDLYHFLKPYLPCKVLDPSWSILIQDLSNESCTHLQMSPDPSNFARADTWKIGFQAEGLASSSDFGHVSSSHWWYMGLFIVKGGYPNSWMVYNGKSHEIGWFWGTPISGNHHRWWSAKYQPATESYWVTVLFVCFRPQLANAIFSITLHPKCWWRVDTVKTISSSPCPIWLPGLFK